MAQVGDGFAAVSYLCHRLIRDSSSHLWAASETRPALQGKVPPVGWRHRAASSQLPSSGIFCWRQEQAESAWQALQLVEKEAGNAVCGPECVKERQWWLGNRMPFFSSLSSGEATVLEKRGAHESAVSYPEGADKIWERRSRTYITALICLNMK